MAKEPTHIQYRGKDGTVSVTPYSATAAGDLAKGGAVNIRSVVEKISKVAKLVQPKGAALGRGIEVDIPAEYAENDVPVAAVVKDGFFVVTADVIIDGQLTTVLIAKKAIPSELAKNGIVKIEEVTQYERV